MLIVVGVESLNGQFLGGSTMSIITKITLSALLVSAGLYTLLKPLSRFERKLAKDVYDVDNSSFIAIRGETFLIIVTIFAAIWLFG